MGAQRSRRRRRRAATHLGRGVAVAAALAGLMAVGVGAQGDRSTPVRFRVDVDFVEVDAVVTDADGNFVRDLVADDFEVYEDGVRQTVSAFALVDLPVERAAPPPFEALAVEPDVHTNTDAVPGRVYLIVLDDYHTMALRSNRVRATARRFVEEHLGTNDLAAVIHTSGRPDASQDFTANRRLLLAAIEESGAARPRSGRSNGSISPTRTRSPICSSTTTAISTRRTTSVGSRRRRRCARWRAPPGFSTASRAAGRTWC